MHNTSIPNPLDFSGKTVLAYSAGSGFFHESPLNGLLHILRQAKKMKHLSHTNSVVV